jgi:hypothetical protein
MAPVVGRCDPHIPAGDAPRVCVASVAPRDPAPRRMGGGQMVHALRANPSGDVRSSSGPSRAVGARPDEARCPHEDRHTRRDPDRVRQPQTMQRGPKQAVVAEFRIGEDPAQREAARPDLAQQRQRLTPLLLETDRRGHAPASAGRIGQPLLGQIERGPQQIRAHLGPERRSRRPDSWRSFPTSRSTGAPRRPSASLVSGSWCHRRSASPRVRGSTRAGGATPHRRATARR